MLHAKIDKFYKKNFLRIHYFDHTYKTVKHLDLTYGFNHHFH